MLPDSALDERIKGRISTKKFSLLSALTKKLVLMIFMGSLLSDAITEVVYILLV